MFLLLVFLFTALFFSFLCSLLESMLLSITPLYATALKNKSPVLGKRILNLKKNMDKPLAAILSLNTIAHTVGAAGVGAQATKVFGSSSIGLVSALLTFLILVFSEIIPKNLGAIYWRQLAPLGTLLIKYMVLVFYPLAFLSQKITQILTPGTQISSITREELHAMAELGEEEGVFHDSESYIFRNLMRFRSLRGMDVMTPRPVISSLPGEMKVSSVIENRTDFTFSRIPIISGNSGDISQYVIKDDIFLAIIRNRTDLKLSELGRDLQIFSEKSLLINIFEKLLHEKEHIALLVDEYGGVSGLITMEDLLETIIGIEIIDETDKAADMQKMARERWIKRSRSMKILQEGKPRKG